MAAPYPLSWPNGWKRTPPGGRQDAPFHRKVYEDGNNWQSKKPMTLATARERLQEQLALLGAVNVTISSNLEALSRAEPADPGVAIYFTYAGKPTVLACDKWARVADNITAIAKHIEAMRGMDRWGVGTAEQAFAAYQALPPPGSNGGPIALPQEKPWHEVLGISPDADRSTISAAYRLKALEVRNDPEKQRQVNVARDSAMRSLEPSS